jgi:hypothetical protein
MPTQYSLSRHAMAAAGGVAYGCYGAVAHGGYGTDVGDSDVLSGG